MMNEDFSYDSDGVMENIAKAEVLSLFFPKLRKALVVDVRRNDTSGPMVRLTAMVSSPQERLRSISKLRSGFPRLRSLTIIPWPRYVESLQSLGVWERLMKRLAEAGAEDAIPECEAALESLRQLEKEELAAVVMGKSYHTIWDARG